LTSVFLWFSLNPLLQDTTIFPFYIFFSGYCLIRFAG
jgi:hypothetical protein